MRKLKTYAEIKNAIRAADRLMLQKVANELTSRNPRCPFCGRKRFAFRQSQGDWPVIECGVCKVQVELRVIKDMREGD
jgi:tRNA(Ile2) C34 agmatinyltransferase TiaS